MPTGLTSDIYEGKDMSLRKFALKCATQFGGGWQASDQGSKPLPLYEAPVIPMNDYYIKGVKKAKEEMEYWLKVEKDPKLAKKLYDEYVAKHEENKARYNQEVNIEMRGRYLQMIDKVEAWNVSETYQNIKDLMLKQLKKSMEWDCPTKRRNSYDFEIAPFKEWLQSQIENQAEYLKLKYEGLKREIKSVNEMNAYLKGLYDEIDKVEPIQKESNQ